MSAPGAARLDASILIATRDRAASLERTLESLVRQATVSLAYEILVVDNGSRDETKRVLDRFAARLPLCALDEPRPGKNRALNRALERARGELLIFTDDDVVCAPDWVASLVEASRCYSSASVFGGPIEPAFPPETPDWIRAPDFPLASQAFGWFPARVEGESEALPYGANLAIRAAIFEQTRFDERIGPAAGRRYAQGSEYELLMRLRARGERFVHVPTARIVHVLEPHQIELDWLLGRAERVGRGSARLKRKRVPKRIAGWIPLYARLALAWLRAWQACAFARALPPSERFALEQRVHYWRGYIAEARVLRAEARAPDYQVGVAGD